MVVDGTQKNKRVQREARQPKDPNLRYKMYTFRLYPTVKQVRTLEWTLRRCAELYNACLEERTAAYQMCRISVSYEMQSEQLPELKVLRPEYREIHSQVLQDVLKRLEKAMQDFFRRIREGQTPGRPRYKSASRYHSFTYPQGGYEIIGQPEHLEKNQKKTCRLALSKIGHIKMVLHRPITGTIKTCTISRDGDHWYAHLSVEQVFDPTLAFHPSTEEVGIDVGIKTYAVLSNGQQIENPRLSRCTEKRIKQAHRKMHHRKKGSHRRNRAKKELIRLYCKTGHRRHDFLHKQSRRLVEQYGTLVFEDLRITNMTARPKPKKDEVSGTYLPNGAAAKSGLNKSINDAAWGSFMRLCASKAEEAGCTVAKVPPYNTTQDCSGCGIRVPKDLSVRWHSCPACGTELDRDENAALNILKRYHEHKELTSEKKKKTPRTSKKPTALVGAGSVPQEPASRVEGRAPCRSPQL
jgi:putative transposase